MIELRTLGSVELRRTDERAAEAVDLQPKRLAVMVYLAVASPRGLPSRDTLLALFWPDLSPARARAALRKTLYRIRESVGREVVTSRGERIGVDREHLRCDAVRFRGALEQGEHAAAMAHYRGGFLPGFHVRKAGGFERWASAQRQELRREARSAALRLSVAAEEDGRRDEALRWARRATEIDPQDERAVRRLIGALDRAGNRTAAVRAYEEFRRRMKQRLDLEPSAETRDLIERIRSRQADGAERGKPAFAPSPRRSPPVSLLETESPEPIEIHSPTPSGRDQDPSGSVSRPAVLKRLDGVRAAGTLAFVALVALGVALIESDNGEGSSGTETVPPGVTPASGPAVAVLPFRTLGPEAQEGYFARGIQEAILNSLGRLEGLTVISPGDGSRFSGALDELNRAGTELGAEHLLVGSVQQETGRLRVTARLLRAESRRQLWAEQFDREASASAVFDVQNEIAREVARALDRRLTERERKRLARRPTDNITAYDYYLRGRQTLGYVIGRPIAEREAVKKSIGLFRRALELDPGFAPAHAGLATAYGDLPALTGNRRWMDSMQAAAKRALEQDPGLPEAHLVLAEYHRRHHGRHHDRLYLRSVRRALELQPNNARASLQLGRWWFAGTPGVPHLDRAVCWMRAAARLEPTDPELHRGVAFISELLGDLEAAEAASRRALKLEPDALRIYRDLVGTALAQGDRGRALRYYRTARPLASSSNPDLVALGGMEVALGMLDSARAHLGGLLNHFRSTWTQAQIELGYALWETGRREQARRLLDPREEREHRALEADRNKYWPAYNLARIHAVRGDDEAAVRAMEKAVELGWLHYYHVVPAFDGPLRKLWDAPRFARLMDGVRARIDSVRTLVEETGCQSIRELPTPTTITG